MSELKEYIVTLNDRKDLDNFYDDMETPGGALYIPDRAVELVNRRPISRNTHYMLTDEEAEQLRQDPRVLAVEIHIRYTDIKIEPAVSRTSNSWSKEVITSTTKTGQSYRYDSTNFIDDKNWALLRCVNGQQITNWGDNLSYVDTTSISRPVTPAGAVLAQTASVIINETGKNVDVVIVDGLIDPSHPEYAVNSDGTGGSRVVQYNWFQHNPAVTGTSISTYDYTLTSNAVNTAINSNNNHGAHVAGTVAGSTQGWAVDANIYNIYPYGSINGMPDTTYTMFDYIREFHKNKAVNPQTGRRNPTITNNSYSFGFTNFASNTTITSISYRGTAVAGPYPNTINKLYGIPDYGASLLVFATALDADIVDAIADGIIVVAAAGNSNYKIDIPGGTDYNNYFKSIYGTKYYHRGGTPNATDGVITVGAVDALSIEYQSYYSNNGPGIDVYAPGTNIISSIGNKYGFRFTYPIMLALGGQRPNITAAADFTSTPDAFKVTKSITGNTAWDSGAYSLYSYAAGMGTAFGTYQTNAAMAIGLRTNILSGLKTDAISLSDLNYAFYINADAQYQIIESGVVIGSNTAYTTSSIFEIWYYDSTIRYAVDGTVIRTVTDLSSNLSMHLDTSIYTPNSSAKIYSMYPIVVDPRNSNYFLDKINGTSMASPQVAGVLACVLQIYPNFTQADCLRYITRYAKTNQLTDVPNSDWTKRYDLNGAPNRYLYYYKERIDSGDIYPKKNFLPRPTSGSTYPRSRIRR